MIYLWAIYIEERVIRSIPFFRAYQTDLPYFYLKKRQAWLFLFEQTASLPTELITTGEAALLGAILFSNCIELTRTDKMTGLLKF